MKTKQISAHWLGLALAGGTLAFAVSTQAAKPPKPPPPPPPPSLTYTLVAFEDGGRLASYASGISEAGLVVGRYGYELTMQDGVQYLERPAVATGTDANGDGLLDLPQELPLLA